jgi:hypothetical protein
MGATCKAGKQGNKYRYIFHVLKVFVFVSFRYCDLSVLVSFT